MRSAFTRLLIVSTLALLGGNTVLANTAESESGDDVPESVILDQHTQLLNDHSEKGFGPQSPRDIESSKGTNRILFSVAPDPSSMNLCNIHFHESAEHRGGEYTKYAGHGNGHGYGTGYLYNGKLSAAETKPFDRKVGLSKHGDLVPGDTIEIHFVHSTAQVQPGPTLGACVSKHLNNPQLRVEAVVGVLVNDRKAADFTKMAEIKTVNGYYAAPNIPQNLGKPVLYEGSTTRPAYNTTGSPYEVTWNVRPKVVKIDILSVAKWLDANPFKEDHAHGVRNLISEPRLLSPITPQTN